PGSSFPLRLFGRGRPGGVRGPAPLCPCHGDSPAPRRVGIRPSGAKPNTGPCVPRRPRGGRSLATPTFQGGGVPLAVLQRLNQITARWLFALLAGAIALGFWLSAPLAPAAGLAPSFLAVMIFAVASSLDMGAFRRAGREPGLWLRSFLLSYIAFPALAWTAGRLLFPHDPLR